jgi:hypothetical protein
VGKERSVLNELRSMTQPDAGLDDVPMPTYVLTSDDDADQAVGVLVDYFGADRARHTVRLRFEDETRYLRRKDLYAAFSGSDKGLGGGGYAQLPGYETPGSAAEFEFRCPHDGCPDSPVFVLTFDDPPVCPRHHVDLELVP